MLIPESKICPFCKQLNEVKSCNEYYSKKSKDRFGETRVEYSVALVYETYYNDLYCGRVTCNTNQLNYCPVCGTKMLGKTAQKESCKDRYEILMTSDAFPDPEDAFAIWDNKYNKYCTDTYGDILTYPTEKEAEEELKKIKEKNLRRIKDRI